MGKLERLNKKTLLDECSGAYSEINILRGQIEKLKKEITDVSKLYEQTERKRRRLAGQVKIIQHIIENYIETEE